MPDKYDADDLRLAEKIVNFVDPTMEWATMERTVAVWIAEYRRSAFPPPAEDARRCAVRVFNLAAQGCPEDHWLHKFDADGAAEIESFAQSRVEPWREALRGMFNITKDSSGVVGYYSGDKVAPWSEFAEVEQAEALLSDSPAKEATK